MDPQQEAMPDGRTTRLGGVHAHRLGEVHARQLGGCMLTGAHPPTLPPSFPDAPRPWHLLARPAAADTPPSGPWRRGVSTAARRNLGSPTGVPHGSWLAPPARRPLSKGEAAASVHGGAPTEPTAPRSSAASRSPNSQSGGAGGVARGMALAGCWPLYPLLPPPPPPPPPRLRPATPAVPPAPFAVHGSPSMRPPSRAADASLVWGPRAGLHGQWV